MKTPVALLSAMPCDRAAAEEKLSAVSERSFAEEWIRSKPSSWCHKDIIDNYVESLAVRWEEVAESLRGLDVMLIANAGAGDLAFSLAHCEVTALLAHHIEHPDGESIGIELFDRTVSAAELETWAPTARATVHLGVCHSSCFIKPLKANSGNTIVISSHGLVEPEFFLRTSAATIERWLRVGGEYAEIHAAIRLALLSRLGLTV